MVYFFNLEKSPELGDTGLVYLLQENIKYFCSFCHLDSLSSERHFDFMVLEWVFPIGMESASRAGRIRFCGKNTQGTCYPSLAF